MCGMLFELKLAGRYFRSGKSRLARFTSAVAVAGIAAGLGGFMIANALSEGFANGIRDKVLENTGHITVAGSGEVRAGQGIVSATIGKIAGVAKVEGTTFEPAAAVIGGSIRYVVVRAVPDSYPGFGAEKRSGPLPVLLGSGFGGPELQHEPVRLLIAGEEGEPAEREMIVAGRFETGLAEYDSTWMYVRESDFAAVKGVEKFEPSSYVVFVDDLYSAEEIAAAVRSALGSGFEVISWQEANRPLFSALALERQVAFWIIALIVLLAVLNITTTLSLLVKERLTEIAVLRTLGADTRMLSAVFLFHGWILSAAGILAGIVSGSIICFAANRFRLISLPAEVYSLNTVVLEPDPVFVAAAAAIAFLLSTAAMAVPLVRASRVKPMDILRSSP